MTFAVNSILLNISTTAVAFLGIYYKLQNFLMMPINGSGQDSSDCEVGCDIEKNADAPLEVADRFFYSKEAEYIKTEDDKNRAFFTLWTLKESYMKMTGRGMSLPLDSFEVLPAVNGFILGKSPGKRCFFKTLEFDGYIFSVSNEKNFNITQTDFCDIMSVSEQEQA